MILKFLRYIIITCALKWHIIYLKMTPQECKQYDQVLQKITAITYLFIYKPVDSNQRDARDYEILFKRREEITNQTLLHCRRWMCLLVDSIKVVHNVACFNNKNLKCWKCIHIPALWRSTSFHYALDNSLIFLIYTADVSSRVNRGRMSSPQSPLTVSRRNF